MLKVLHHYLQVPESVPPERKRIHQVGLYCWPIGIIVHITFAIIFWMIRVPELVYLNIFGVLAYLIIIHFHTKQQYGIAASIALIEMIIFDIVSIIYLGWDVGMQFWFFTHPIVIYMVYNRSISFKKFLVLSSFSFFVLSHMIVGIHGPIREIDMAYHVILTYFNAFLLIFSIAAIIRYLDRTATLAEEAERIEKNKSDKLLLNILPKRIADRLKNKEELIADKIDSCSIFFSDLVGFTKYSQKLSPEEIVSDLNEVFSIFDDTVAKYGLEKIKTIGDAYMIASGVPTENQDHAKNLIDCALEIMRQLDILRESNPRIPNIRAGVNSGPVVAGVIGKKKFAYDLWGDTVNTASRMESHGMAGKIHISESTYELVKEYFEIEKRGKIQVKGKGVMFTYFIIGKKTEKTEISNSLIRRKLIDALTEK